MTFSSDICIFSKKIKLIGLIMPQRAQKFYDFAKKTMVFRWILCVVYCALRRKSRALRPKTALKEEQTVHLLLIQYIIQRRFLECKQFFASGIFYFLRQDYRIYTAKSATERDTKKLDTD